MAKRSTKAGSGQAGAAHRRKLFLDAYLTNGRNATQAAITAGFSPKTARAQGCTLLTHPDIVQSLQRATARIEAISGLTVERTLQEVARLAYFDPRTLFRADGTLKTPEEWDDDTAAAVAQIEVDEHFERTNSDNGEKKTVVYGTSSKKLKVWDKNAALEKAMRYLGLYEKDNRQRGADLALQVVMIGPG